MDLVLIFLLPTVHISHVIVESLLLTLIRKMVARNPCYEFPSILEQNDMLVYNSIYCLYI